MKQETMFPDYPELSEKSGASVANLQKIQHGLLVGLGAILTYIILSVGAVEPPFDSFAAIFLWWMLLLAPIIAGLVVLKFPSWQKIPLALRKECIFQSFGLGLLTLSTTFLFTLKWNWFMVDAVVTTASLTLGYGIFLIWLHFRLSRQVEYDAGDLFP